MKDDGSNNRIKKIKGQFWGFGICFGFGEDGSNEYMYTVSEAECRSRNKIPTSIEATAGKDKRNAGYLTGNKKRQKSLN